MERRWRFGVDSSRAPRVASDDDTWLVTASTLAAFRRVSEVICPILTSLSRVSASRRPAPPRPAPCARPTCLWVNAPHRVQGAVPDVED